VEKYSEVSWSRLTTDESIRAWAGGISQMAVAAADLRRPHVALRARLSTTPGRLRLAAVVLVAAAVAFGIAMATTAAARHEAADAVATRTEPLLVQSDRLYASLSDADATATTTFLISGLEPVARRQRYLADIASASARLTSLAEQVGSSADAREAVSVLSTRLPVYSGLVETARANNRQGRPVGAAYLRQASGIMRGEILPAAGRLYEIEARRLDADYRSSTSTAAFIALAVAGSLLLALLVATQLGLARFSHRILNVPLVAATFVLVALAVWVLLALDAEQSSLSAAQRKGSDSVQVLSAVRVLGLRAQRDEGLALVARGGDTQDLDDVDTVMRTLRPGQRTGLLAEARMLAARAGSTRAIDELVTSFADYQRVHRRVAAAEIGGDFTAATNAFIARETPLSDRIGANLQAQIALAQQRFAHSATRAASVVSALTVGIVIAAAAIALLAVVGLAQRIEEYR
jgi:hypothetical protein